MVLATNKSSKFTSFSFTLPNNTAVTGIAHIPPPASWTQTAGRPLIVALHGGTCTSHHYDISPEYTSSITSEATGIPIVAIDRPCYGGTTSILPLLAEDESQSFYGLTATCLHEHILPKIWEQFGVPNSCTGLVLLSHSLAVPPSIVIAANNAGQPRAPHAYRLTGMVFSGFAAPGTGNNVPASEGGIAAKEIVFPQEAKRLLMTSEPELHCADPSILPLIDAQSTRMPREEMFDIVIAKWPGSWEQIAEQVEVPILFRMGEHDWLWKTDRESLEKFSNAFKNSSRFDSAVIPGAPHALEMWSKAQQWYDLVFQFAKETCE